MALRQLLISKKIATKRSELKALKEKDGELRQRKEDLEKRSIELESAIDELTPSASEEDRTAVDEAVEELEQDEETLKTDQKAHDDAKSTLETEIQTLQDELDQIDDKADEPAPIEETEPKQRKDVNIRMITRMKFFGKMTRDERTQFVERQEIKDFTARVRGFASEQRAVSNSELLIPDIMLELLRDNLHRYSKLITKVRVKPVKGKARQRIAGNIPEGIWTEAVGVLNELSLTFSQVEVDGYKVGGFIPVANSLLEDSDINLIDEIMDALGQAIGIAIDKAIIYGTGVKMPLGYVTRLAQDLKPADWSDDAPEWKDLHLTNLLKIDMSVLEPDEFFAELTLSLCTAKANYSNGETFWCMNSKTRAQIMAKSITFNAAGAIVASQNNTMPVVGGEIIILEFMPDGDIAGGYGSLYTLAERAGASLAESKHYRFIEDQTVFKGTARYDGMPIFGEGFVVVNINNTAPTTTASFPADTANAG